MAFTGNAMDLTDKDYVIRCCDGHPDDFRVLVDRYQGLLFSFLTRRLGDQSNAEEAVQESFVRAFFSLKKLRKPESFPSWLMGIAGRVAQEHFRVMKRRRKIGDSAADLPAIQAEDQEDIPLDEAIAALPETYRQAVLLRYYEDLSCREIAGRLELPIGTVTKNLSRAYLMLRQELGKREKNSAGWRDKP
jgi:RNA polymerase sigma-70 factor (ECF subfamily)